MVLIIHFFHLLNSNVFIFISTEKNDQKNSKMWKKNSMERFAIVFAPV